MLNIIFSIINRATERFFNKKIIVIPAEQNSLIITAAKSTLGFWYAGNIFDSGDIAYGIARNGVVEKFETETVLAILKTLPQDFGFFDVGANTGYYGILAGTLFPKSTIHSFEPIPTFASKIKESVALNHLTNVTVHEAALGSKPGRNTMYLSGSGTTFIPEFSGITNTSHTIEVPIETLDSIVESTKTIPHFIKIDVEGFEPAVLTGAHQTIKENTPIVFVEIADTLIRNNKKYIHTSYEETVKTITQYGYDIFVLVDNSIVPISQKPRSLGVAMYLCLNREKHSPVYKVLNL